MTTSNSGSGYETGRDRVSVYEDLGYGSRVHTPEEPAAEKVYSIPQQRAAGKARHPASDPYIPPNSPDGEDNILPFVQPTEDEDLGPAVDRETGQKNVRDTRGMVQAIIDRATAEEASQQVSTTPGHSGHVGHIGAEELSRAEEALRPARRLAAQTAARSAYPRRSA